MRAILILAAMACASAPPVALPPVAEASLPDTEESLPADEAVSRANDPKAEAPHASASTSETAAVWFSVTHPEPRVRRSRSIDCAGPVDSCYVRVKGAKRTTKGPVDPEYDFGI